MPPVWASPSRMSGAGITGKPGKWSAKWSSARLRFFTAVAVFPDSKLTNRSIHVQRMGSALLRAHPHGEVAHEQVHGEQVLDLVHPRVLLELDEVGVGHLLFEGGQPGGRHLA